MCFCFSVLYEHLGCYKNYENENDTTLPDDLGRVSSVVECYRLAKLRGYPAFGIQSPNKCVSHKKALQRYYRHGISTDCNNKKMGGEFESNVFKILGQ